MLTLNYKNGLIVIENAPVSIINDSILKKEINKDGKFYTLPGYKYRYLIWQIKKQQLKYVDKVAKFEAINSQAKLKKAYDYQKNAIDNWLKKKWGVINFPTGSGKTFIATNIINIIQRPSLIIVPTIDLMQQWAKILAADFNIEIGFIGAGKDIVRPISVTTYNSAAIYSETLGNKYCLLVFDEVHHASAFTSAIAAKNYVAPFRLGLTATMPDMLDRLQVLKDIVGPVIDYKKTDELVGDYLADFTTDIVPVELNSQERADYEYHREIYTKFKNKQHFDHFTWQAFVFRANQSKEGLVALKSFHQQKSIAYNAKAKYDYLEKLIKVNKNKKMLIFTNDNDSAKTISERFNLKLIIHDTKKKERVEILTDFRDGKIKHIVSSRVLNEGIDVPDVKIAVVFSGTGTTREHKQRLGRLLRKTSTDKAQLIELVSKDTSEEFTSARRNNF